MRLTPVPPIKPTLVLENIHVVFDKARTCDTRVIVRTQQNHPGQYSTTAESPEGMPLGNLDWCDFATVHATGGREINIHAFSTAKGNSTLKGLGTALMSDFLTAAKPTRKDEVGVSSNRPGFLAYFKMGFRRRRPLRREGVCSLFIDHDHSKHSPRIVAARDGDELILGQPELAIWQQATANSKGTPLFRNKHLASLRRINLTRPLLSQLATASPAAKAVIRQLNLQKNDFRSSERLRFSDFVTALNTTA